jgi:hypothetical protein
VGKSGIVGGVARAACNQGTYKNPLDFVFLQVKAGGLYAKQRNVVVKTNKGSEVYCLVDRNWKVPLPAASSPLFVWVPWSLDVSTMARAWRIV